MKAVKKITLKRHQRDGVSLNIGILKIIETYCIKMGIFFRIDYAGSDNPQHPNPNAQSENSMLLENPSDSADMPKIYLEVKPTNISRERRRDIEFKSTDIETLPRTRFTAINNMIMKHLQFQVN